MNYTLNIQLSASDGAVIRTLGLIERRGFRLGKCSVSEVDSHGRSVQVTVSSERPGDLLQRQLQRLHDVLKVELQPVLIINQVKPGIRPIKRRV